MLLIVYFSHFSGNILEKKRRGGDDIVGDGAECCSMC